MKHAPDKCQRLICKCGSSELFSNPITVMENPVRYLVEMENIDSKHPYLQHMVYYCQEGSKLTAADCFYQYWTLFISYQDINIEHLPEI